MSVDLACILWSVLRIQQKMLTMDQDSISLHKEMGDAKLQRSGSVLDVHYDDTKLHSNKQQEVCRINFYIFSMDRTRPGNLLLQKLCPDLANKQRRHRRRLALTSCYDTLKKKTNSIRKSCNQFFEEPPTKPIVPVQPNAYYAFDVPYPHSQPFRQQNWENKMGRAAGPRAVYSDPVEFENYRKKNKRLNKWKPMKKAVAFMNTKPAKAKRKLEVDLSYEDYRKEGVTPPWYAGKKGDKPRKRKSKKKVLPPPASRNRKSTKKRKSTANRKSTVRNSVKTPSAKVKKVISRRRGAVAAKGRRTTRKTSTSRKSVASRNSKSVRFDRNVRKYTIPRKPDTPKQKIKTKTKSKRESRKSLLKAAISKANKETRKMKNNSSKEVFTDSKGKIQEKWTANMHKINMNSAKIEASAVPRFLFSRPNKPVKEDMIKPTKQQKFNAEPNLLKRLPNNTGAPLGPMPPFSTQCYLRYAFGYQSQYVINQACNDSRHIPNEACNVPVETTTHVTHGQSQNPSFFSSYTNFKSKNTTYDPQVSSNISNRQNHISQPQNHISDSQNHISQPLNHFPHSQSHISLPKNYISNHPYRLSQPQSNMSHPQSHISQPKNNISHRPYHIPQRQNFISKQSNHVYQTPTTNVQQKNSNFNQNQTRRYKITHQNIQLPTLKPTPNIFQPLTKPLHSQNINQNSYVVTSQGKKFQPRITVPPSNQILQNICPTLQQSNMSLQSSNTTLQPSNSNFEELETTLKHLQPSHTSIDQSIPNLGNSNISLYTNTSLHTLNSNLKLSNTSLKPLTTNLDELNIGLTISQNNANQSQSSIDQSRTSLKHLGPNLDQSQISLNRSKTSLNQSQTSSVASQTDLEQSVPNSNQSQTNLKKFPTNVKESPMNKETSDSRFSLSSIQLTPPHPETSSTRKTIQYTFASFEQTAKSARVERTQMENTRPGTPMPTPDQLPARLDQQTKNIRADNTNIRPENIHIISPLANTIPLNTIIHQT